MGIHYAAVTVMALWELCPLTLKLLHLWMDTMSPHAAGCEQDILSLASRLKQVENEGENRKGADGRSGRGYR